MNKSKSQTAKQTWITFYFFTQKGHFLGSIILFITHTRTYFLPSQYLYWEILSKNIQQIQKKTTNFLCGLFYFNLHIWLHSWIYVRSTFPLSELFFNSIFTCLRFYFLLLLFFNFMNTSINQQRKCIFPVRLIFSCDCFKS